MTVKRVVALAFCGFVYASVALAQDAEGDVDRLLAAGERPVADRLCYFDGKAYSVGAHKTMAGTLFRCSRSAPFGVSWSAFPPDGYCAEGDHNYPSGAMIRRGGVDGEPRLASCENGTWVES
ncbi:DUF1496 domain-containing protein [Aliiroseovarius sp.]|uniref:DUF1496 domain-containing protein n=1 Tax=Aliiroseovarius sp. TaxID=1872442 RepID=UPI003BA8D29F